MLKHVSTLTVLLTVLASANVAAARSRDDAESWHTTGHPTDPALLGAAPDSSESDVALETDAGEDEAASEEARQDDATDGDTGQQVRDKATEQKPLEEQSDETYRFIGLRTRVVIIPKFMFGLYQADGGTTVTSYSVGPEYVSRRNNFGYAAWLTYSSYGMDNVPFKAKSDPDVAYELVTSELKVLTLGADFLWSVPIDHGFSFVYGGGAGLGAVFGNLHRNQA